jgi:ATP-dependent DNA helicase RecG
MMSSDMEVRSLKGVGPKMETALRVAGIRTVRDLLLTFPKSYENLSVSAAPELSDGQAVTLKAVVLTHPETTRHGRLSRTVFDVLADGLTLTVTVFNRAFLTTSLSPGDERLIKGVYHAGKKAFVASSLHRPDSVPELRPIYGLDDVHDKTVSSVIRTVLDEPELTLEETLPESDLMRYRLKGLMDAIRACHAPASMDDLLLAVRRFKYEEAFYFALAVATNTPDAVPRPPKPVDIGLVKKMIASLPFDLTQDQKDAVNDIFRDFRKDRAQFRLIQGDVGSGKTVVAGLAAAAVSATGEQVAIMAPTELLARQHHAVLSSLFPGMDPVLLSGKVKDKKMILTSISDGTSKVIVGTHAIIEEDVVFDNLGLIVIDEQHRFGVRARNDLGNKASTKDIIYLTATPIPRTLAMVMFKDANVSVIRQKPASRTPVLTRIVTPEEIGRVHDEMDIRLNQGDNVFVVVPAIDSTTFDDTVQTVRDRLTERFHHPVDVMHARLDSVSRESVMDDFRHGHGRIMVATTMIEVGIDVPHATMMVVMQAERFGLSQLHQLRGRVGRGDKPSVCHLVTGREDTVRLQLLESTDDGFELAAKDLELRGPGQFLGPVQSGFVRFAFLDFVKDTAIVEEARKSVRELIANNSRDLGRFMRILGKRHGRPNTKNVASTM